MCHLKQTSAGVDKGENIYIYVLAYAVMVYSLLKELFNIFHYGWDLLLGQCIFT